VVHLVERGFQAAADNPGLRAWLENRDLNYVMAVSCDQRFITPRGPVRADELACYLCHTRHPVPLAELVRVAGSRWGVEETFQFAKNETGLDHCQVRRYDAWCRHITLSMLAAAFLAVTAHAERVRDHKGVPDPSMNN
jgi:SRSO17 transposase